MKAAQHGAGRGEPVARFHATSGRVVGFLSLVVVVAVLVRVAVGAHTIDGLRLATGAAFFGVLVWLTQMRPRATAYADLLLLQNSLRDVSVPLALIDDVHVGRMLSVAVGEERYVCIGIGAPLRKMARAGRGSRSPLSGWNTSEGDSDRSAPPRPKQVPISYPAFVETRIRSLAEDARRRSRAEDGTTDEPVRRLWVWPGLVALVLTGAAFAVSLLL